MRSLMTRALGSRFDAMLRRRESRTLGPDTGGIGPGRQKTATATDEPTAVARDTDRTEHWLFAETMNDDIWDTASAGTACRARVSAGLDQLAIVRLDDAGSLVICGCGTGT